MFMRGARGLKRGFSRGRPGLGLPRVRVCRSLSSHYFLVLFFFSGFFFLILPRSILVGSKSGYDCRGSEREIPLFAFFCLARFFLCSLFILPFLDVCV